MQNKSSYNGPNNQNIMASILQGLPKESSLTKIEYEGPSIALYSDNPAYLLKNNQVISNMVNTLRKRIVIRTDESIRKPKTETIGLLNSIVSKEIETECIFFDDALGEVVIYVRNPVELSTSIERNNFEIIEKTGWKLKFRRKPSDMSVVGNIHKVISDTAEERIQFYKNVGERIFRSKLDDSFAEASIIALGGFAEVGRSAILLSTHESKILLDCGLNEFAKESMDILPRLDITGIVTDISPDVKLTLTPSCHILGSSVMHLHIGNGDHNIVYTSEMRFQESILFGRPTFNFPRVETLIIESTYGNKEDIFPDYELAVQRLVDSMNSTLINKGIVLLPIPHIGLAQELLLIIDKLITSGKIVKTNILAEKSIADIWSIHEVYSEYLSEETNNLVYQASKNPFHSGHFTIVQSHILDNEPAIILSPLFTKNGGPLLHYLKQISGRQDSKIILTSYQMPGSLGRFIQEGGKQMSVDGQDIELHCLIEKIDGLDVHSDYNQLMNYGMWLRPKLSRVLVNHGERSKVQNLAASINRMLKIQTQHPSVLEAVKLV